jgi:hypothetical protein
LAFKNVFLFFSFERSDTNLSEDKTTFDGIHDSKKTLKPILKKGSNFEKKQSGEEEICISDVTIKKLLDYSSTTKIKFNDEIKVTRIENFKQYNKLDYVPESDKCNCQII